MNAATPSEGELTAEIRARQARERLMLLEAPLAPGECLRQAQALNITERKMQGLLERLDHPRLAPSLVERYVDKYTSYRTYAKGSLLGAIEGLPSLALRWQYIDEIEQQAKRFVDQIEAAGKDVAQVKALARQAVDFRNLTRDRYAARAASEVARLKKIPWEATSRFGKQLLMGPPKDERNLVALIGKVKQTHMPFEDLGQDKQLQVLTGVAERSGRAGTLSTLGKYAGPAMLVIDLAHTVNDALDARDPYRTVGAAAVRLGAGAAVGWATQTVMFGVVTAFAMGTGVGAAVMLFGSMGANAVLNDLINSAAMRVYDDFNPRISAVLRDVSWEPVDYKLSMEEEMPPLSMTCDFKAGMVDEP